MIGTSDDSFFAPQTPSVDMARSSSANGMSHSSSVEAPKPCGIRRRRRSCAPPGTRMRGGACPAAVSPEYVTSGTGGTPSSPSPIMFCACPYQGTCNNMDTLICLGKKLLRAAQSGKRKCVRALLENGADPSFCGPGGWTPLHRAAADAHACVMEELLNAGACPNARNCCGHTPLHLASGADFCGRCVSLLLEAGADLGSRTKCGRTPLHYAAIAGNEVAVRTLVSAGASEIAEDDKGRTPYNVAKTVCVRRLLRASSRRKRPCNCNYFRPPDCCSTNDCE